MNFKKFTHAPFRSHSTAASLVETLHDVNYLVWDAVFPDNFPQRLSMDAIKSLLETDKVQQSWPLPSQTLVDYLPQREDLIATKSAFAESRLVCSQCSINCQTDSVQ